MKSGVVLLMAVAATSVYAGAADRGVATGRVYYEQAQYRKAAASFEAACEDDEPGACYWAGMSYDKVADISMQFGCRANAKARHYFTRPMTLAAGERLYRHRLFQVLLNSTDCSPTALRAAAEILAATPASIPIISRCGAVSRTRSDSALRLTLA